MRRIVHLDMDCFYAAVEMRDDPLLRGRPVAVAWSGPRGVVLTANYEARAFCVRSAMATALALRKCPQLVLAAPRMAVYREVSSVIREVFSRYTDLVEPLSLDEAYLDGEIVAVISGRNIALDTLADVLKGEDATR